jgi:hypothetical protein
VSLSPTLTKFDERVLTAIPADRAERTKFIVAIVQRHYGPGDMPTRRDIIETLRGLEHLGLCQQRNGWWRR